MEDDENSTSDELEKEILAYLNRRLHGEAEETHSDSILLASLFERLE